MFVELGFALGAIVAVVYEVFAVLKLGGEDLSVLQLTNLYSQNYRRKRWHESREGGKDRGKRGRGRERGREREKEKNDNVVDLVI